MMEQMVCAETRLNVFTLFKLNQNENEGKTKVKGLGTNFMNL